MIVQKKKYSNELKMEIAEAELSGKSPFVLGKEYDIAPNMISRWKRQCLEGKFHGTSKTDTELKKHKIKVCTQ